MLHVTLRFREFVLFASLPNRGVLCSPSPRNHTLEPFGEVERLEQKEERV